VVPHHWCGNALDFPKARFIAPHQQSPNPAHNVRLRFWLQLPCELCRALWSSRLPFPTATGQTWLVSFCQELKSTHILHNDLANIRAFLISKNLAK
jgi:hypothetical protein